MDDPTKRVGWEVRGLLRHRLGGISGAQVAFAILALLVVCSLVAGSLGSLFLDGFQQDDSDVDQSLGDPAGELTSRLEAMLADDSENMETRLLLANTLANTGRLREAIPYYEQVLDQNPGNVVARLDFAESLASGGNYADAELQFKRVLAEEPENVEARYYAAELYRSWRPPRVDEAAEEYREVIRLDSNSFFAQLAGDALIELGKATPVASPVFPPGMEGTP